MSFNIVKLTDPIQLTNVVGGLVPKGAYNAGTDYAVGDSVDYNGSSYVMHTDAAAGTVPTNTTYWQVLANKGDTGAKGDTGDTGPAGADGADGLTVSVNSVTQVAGDISLTQDNIPDGTTNKAYTAAEQTKLSGIEALADVTDATNVASAGAVMDGDFSSNGLMTRTAAGTYTNRTITGTANQVTVTNGDGVSGNPTLSLPQNIHTGASPTFGNTNVVSTAGNAYLRINTDSTALTTKEAQIDLYSGSTYARQFYRDSDKNYGLFVNGTTRIRIIGGTGAIQLNGSTSPYGDSLYTLGNPSEYWSNTYTDRLYLNSTAYLDGATAGALTVTGMLGLGSSPTHSITLSSTATGISLYNTTDQTTNYERGRLSWSSNVLTLQNELGGTGVGRKIQLLVNGPSSSTTSLTLDRVFSPFVAITHNTTTIAGMTVFTIGGTSGHLSSIYTSTSITPTISQSGTAGYTALLINPTETSTGSGTKLLIDAQVGGVSKFKVDNTGKITSPLSQTYSITNVTTDRAYDANATTLDEVADTLGTLIADLRSLGLVV